MAYEIKAYKPKCCNKAYLYKGSAVKHEKKCWKNKDNKACFTCKHFEKEYNTVYVPPRGDQNYGDADYDEEYSVCNHFEKEVSNYPIYNKKDEETNISFQTNCKFWKEMMMENEKK